MVDMKNDICAKEQYKHHHAQSCNGERKPLSILSAILFILVVKVLLAACVLAVPHPNTNHVLRKRHSHDAAAAGWIKRRSIPQGTTLPVRIGLKQQCLDIGHDLLMEIADPTSPRYGKHYTMKEVHDIFAPHSTTVNTLLQWLADNGITDVSQSPNRQWLKFNAMVEDVEALLKTKYHEYQHESGDLRPACDEYHVPAHVQEHVGYIWNSSHDDQVWC